MNELKWWFVNEKWQKNICIVKAPCYRLKSVTLKEKNAMPVGSGIKSTAIIDQLNV